MRKHVIARAPVRISFGGGGTDLAAYYRRHGGFVVSTAIDRYCYVVASDSRDGGISINSADYGLWQSTEPGQNISVEEPLALAKAAVEWFQNRGLLPNGVDLFLSSEVQPGTGLGSSSAMAVALLTALAGYANEQFGPLELSETASYLEIERLGMPIGKQDQFASAFGGLNAIAFSSKGVLVRAISIPWSVADKLSSRLLLFSTGQSRHSAQILEKQGSESGKNPQVTESLHLLKCLAHEIESSLEQGRLDDFGRLLDRGWQLKKRLSERISTQHIDSSYAAAIDAGALGGKITGAGGGGFLLLYCPLERQPALTAAMTRAGLCQLTFGLDFEGARVVGATGSEGAWMSAVSNVVSEHVLSQKRSDKNIRIVHSPTIQQEDATNA
jgi:D-glycero-alpha-D-manno-heptose-7-phosphate kinase